MHHSMHMVATLSHNLAELADHQQGDIDCVQDTLHDAQVTGKVTADEVQCLYYGSLSAAQCPNGSNNNNNMVPANLCGAAQGGETSSAGHGKSKQLPSSHRQPRGLQSPTRIIRAVIHHLSHRIHLAHVHGCGEGGGRKRGGGRRKRIL